MLSGRFVPAQIGPIDSNRPSIDCELTHGVYGAVPETSRNVPVVFFGESNMKRLATVVALTLIAVSCQDIPGPELTIEEPQLAISDGGHGGNPHFFFLPPMVPSRRN